MHVEPARSEMAQHVKVKQDITVGHIRWLRLITKTTKQYDLV